MLAASDVSVESVLSQFSSRGIEVALLVPTATGLSKSILDATAPVRRFLNDHRIHSYEAQQHGQENKRVISAFYVEPGRTVPTKVSFYRPITKDGDPRIWFYNLNKYAKPNNLLVVLDLEGTLFVINASRIDITAEISRGTGEVALLVQSLTKVGREAADMLIQMLKKVAAIGWHKSVISGDTGVGMTLESALGIPPNNNKFGDFKGIEIKSARVSRAGKIMRSRSNLFSQIPDWNASTLKSGIALLERCGYECQKTGRLQLYCTVAARKMNDLGLFLTVNEFSGKLENYHTVKERRQSLVCWDLEVLRTRLKEKHSESMWVQANSSQINGTEYFQYFEATYTRAPVLSNLDILLESGGITMDFTLSRKNSGRARDHGYLFKIRPESFDLLFPTQERIQLI